MTNAEWNTKLYEKMFAELEQFKTELSTQPFQAILDRAYEYCILFGIAGAVIGLLGILTLISVSVKNGIILLVIAFLVSPMGLPMAAAWLLGQLQHLRYAIQEAVYG